MNAIVACAWIARNKSFGVTIGELAVMMKITRRRAETILTNLQEEGLALVVRQDRGRTWVYRFFLTKDAQDLIVNTAKEISEGKLL